MSTAVDRLFGDMHQAAASLTVGRSITYRLFVSSKLSPATGKLVEVWHDVPILDAVNTMVESREILAGGPLQVGDERYAFPEAALADHLRFAAVKEQSTQDRIVDDGTSYRVIAWTDTGAITRVTVRK